MLEERDRGAHHLAVVVDGVRRQPFGGLLGEEHLDGFRQQHGQAIGCARRQVRRRSSSGIGV